VKHFGANEAYNAIRTRAIRKFTLKTVYPAVPQSIKSPEEKKTTSLNDFSMVLSNLRRCDGPEIHQHKAISQISRHLFPAAPSGATTMPVCTQCPQELRAALCSEWNPEQDLLVTTQCTSRLFYRQLISRGRAGGLS
jgi:hypothetical protein